MSQLDLLPAPCWCAASDLWAFGKFCTTARALEGTIGRTVDHTNALRISASITSVGGFHCEGCGAFVQTTAWDGVKSCAACRGAA